MTKKMAEFGPLITTTGMFMGAPIYTEWKDDWGTMMEDFEETSDNCEYLMRAMETEEIRQSQWLVGILVTVNTTILHF